MPVELGGFGDAARERRRAIAHRLNENLGAVNIELTTAELDEIETAWDSIQIQGARYPEHLERLTGH